MKKGYKQRYGRKKNPTAHRLNNKSMVERLRSWWGWVADGNCWIKNRAGQLIRLAPNTLQRRIHEVMLEQAMRGDPIRLIVLKDRKPGCSTWVQIMGYFLSKMTEHWHSQLVAHSKDDTRRIFEIAGRAARYDETFPLCKEHSKLEVEFEHDSYADARTAGGDFVSSGSTLNVLHVSELAKWPGGKAGVTQQLTSLLNAVPDAKESIVVLESTAEAGDDEFKVRWELAESGNSPYVPIFHSWLENTAKVARIPAGGLGELDEDEQKLRDKHGAKDDQLQWRRRKLRGDCRGDRIQLMQDHPTTPEEAFQVATGKIFEMLARDTHDLEVSVDELLTRNYMLYRGLDWGGADPFAVVWLAYHQQPESPGFTIDIEACPNTWRELTGYYYDDHGKPKDKNNHTVDALRYAIMQFGMIAGHVHVWREMYLPHTAARGMSDIDHAHEIMTMDARLPIMGTCGDPSQPKTIVLVNNVGLGVTAYERAGRAMDIKDGIAHMRALMLATHPLVFIPDPEPQPLILARKAAEAEFEFGVGDSEMLVAMDSADRKYGGDEWFGSLG